MDSVRMVQKPEASTTRVLAEKRPMLRCAWRELVLPDAYWDYGMMRSVWLYPALPRSKGFFTYRAGSDTT
jgi:hypothetical protein